MKDIIWLWADSSNVKLIGRPRRGTGLFIRFHNDKTYYYEGVSRQRAVALMHRRRLWNKSVGQYINRVIKPQFKAAQVV